MSVVGVGTDVLEEARIARLVDSGGSRFLAHWYTAAEVEMCFTSARPSRVAATCFAVKEAALKAIGISFPGPLMWREIEVSLDDAGSVTVRLAGDAAVQATRSGVVRLHASTARTAGWLAAVVVAEG
ncbi:holo-ACP synthase [Nocardioides glacieisoli]|uniref:holo-ACP synthase n=1 Tax=Nocardioides glacieisoli TaxID=1168730 RepID=UPI0013ECE7CC|nr:holo-ACP synthase [Nocardioides glacieisoli]